MRETENIFDTSTTLMDIDEPAAGDADARPDNRPPPDAGGEPDYFTPNPASGQMDGRRRALAVLGLVGGGLFTVVLISAATGSGESRPAPTAKSPAPSERPVGGGSATVVAPVRAPQARPRRAPAAPTHAQEAPKGRRHTGDGGKRAAHAHRRHHSGAPQRSAPQRSSPQRSSPPPPPPPEPTYAAEPETTYVPEETAPPPASTPSGGAQPEFGFEP